MFVRRICLFSIPIPSCTVKARFYSSDSSLFDKKVIRKLLPYIWPKNDFNAKFRIGVALTLMLGGKLLNLQVPLLFKDVVDVMNANAAVIASDAAPNVLSAAGAILVGYLAARVGSSAFSEFKNVVFAKVAQKAIRKVSSDVFVHLHKMDHSFHLTRQTGALARSLDRSHKGISFMFTALVFNVVPTALELALVCGYLSWKYGWQYSAMTLGTMSLYTLYTFAITKWRTQFRRQMNAAENAFSNRAIDSLINHESVKAFCNEKFEQQQYDKQLQKYEEASLKTATSLCYLNVGQATIFGLSLSSMMYMACRGIAYDGLTVGDLVLINGLVFQLSLPLNFLGSVYRELKQAVIDIESVFQLLELKPNIVESEKQLNITAGKIEFDHVSFAYQSSREILRNFSITVEPGKKLAIVGPSGCGKSTVTKLLLRFFEPGLGKILIDEQDITQFSLHSLRSAIGFVPQDIPLFNDTIYYNILYGNPDANEEDVILAAKRANIHDIIMRFPDKYQSKVGERGLVLSGGEKQRIAIARVLLKNPKLLVFDEATSSLDSHSEQSILQTFHTIARDKSTIYIAHRLSTVMNADEIIVLSDGQIVERGTHSQLLMKKGLYAEMWYKQQQQEQHNDK